MYNKFNRRTTSDAGRPVLRDSASWRTGRPKRRPAFAKFSNIDESRFINKATENNTVTDYVPVHKFTDFNVDERLKKNIVQKGFIKPTPIQDKAIPEILKGNDIIGLADTGTGKTAAFLLPFIDKILKNKSEKVLILAPTRELALQINAEFMEFSRFLSIHSVVAVGGSNIASQLSQIRRGFSVLIGTPGRVKDLVKRKALKLDGFTNVVLDEADRMLDMGFIVDMRFLLGQLRPQRQTLFFSATISREVELLTQEFLKNPVKIAVKTRDTSTNVEQDVIKVKPTDDKIELLHNLLIQEEFKKVLIFGRTKIGVEKLSTHLYKKGFKVQSIHGNKSQSARQTALKLFKEEKVKVLVATDVAARGLDIPEVTHVINFEIPATYEDYIHRIGRTGRAHRKGKALTFVDERPARPQSSPFRQSRNFSGQRSFFGYRSFGKR